MSNFKVMLIINFARSYIFKEKWNLLKTGQNTL